MFSDLEVKHDDRLNYLERKETSLKIETVDLKASAPESASILETARHESELKS